MDQVVAVTSDNGSNLIAAFSSVDCEGLSYFGHNLKLAISTDCVQQYIKSVAT